MEYHFNIKHKPGNTNVADYLSRNPISSSTINEITNSAEDFVNFIEYNSKPSAIKIEEIPDWILAEKQTETINGQKVEREIRRPGSRFEYKFSL